jgi:hypothetical protein
MSYIPTIGSEVRAELPTKKEGEMLVSHLRETYNS